MRYAIAVVVVGWFVFHGLVLHQPSPRPPEAGCFHPDGRFVSANQVRRYKSTDVPRDRLRNGVCPQAVINNWKPAWDRPPVVSKAVSDWISDYVFAPIGTVLKLVLSGVFGVGVVVVAFYLLLSLIIDPPR